MDFRRPRTALLGAMMAFLAILAMGAIAGWHGAAVHDEDPVHAASIAHIDGEASRSDPDAPIHIAAHAAGQWLVAADQTAAPAVALASSPSWYPVDALFRTGIDPAALLKPPRA